MGEGRERLAGRAASAVPVSCASGGVGSLRNGHGFRVEAVRARMLALSEPERKVNVHRGSHMPISEFFWSVFKDCLEQEMPVQVVWSCLKFNQFTVLGGCVTCCVHTDGVSEACR